MNYAEHLLPVKNVCGEIPMWIPEKKMLYWSDFDARSFYRYSPDSGEVLADELKLMIAGWGRREKGGWITSNEDEISFWNEESLAFETLARPEAEKENIKMQDAVVDKKGRFLFGTMDVVTFDAPNSSLYSYTAGEAPRLLETGLALSNGLSFSPDGKTLYVTDMFHHRILAFDYEIETGEIAGRRIFASIPDEKGFPDGLVTDSDGYLWSCHFGGWCITRYSPEGKIDRVIELPVSIVSCCGFGGDDLSDLYITTGSKTLSEEQLARQPMAGDLFVLKTDVQGLADWKFAG